MNFTELDKKQKELLSILNEKLLYNKNSLDHLNIKLTYNSNAIEGNTLSELQTATFIEKQLTASGKSLREHHEAINHYDAFNYIFERSLDKKNLINEKDILNIHSFILRNINDEEKGKYRNVRVSILGSNTVLPNYLKVPELMSEFNNWLESKNNLHPLEKAVEAHYKLVTIHPFVDGNGRTSRLLMNGILLQNDYPPMIIKKEDREEYLSSLELRQTKEDSSKYNELMFNIMNSSLDYYLDIKKDMNLTKFKKTSKDNNFDR